MGILIGIVFYGAIMIAFQVFGGWTLLIMVGGFALFLLYGMVQASLEQRAARKTVERLLALEPQRSWSDWALPAAESYALLRGVTNVKSDAFKLGLLQMIAMGVLASDGGEAPDGGGGNTTLKRVPAPGDALAGSLVPIHRLWVASTKTQVDEVEDQVVEAQVEEAKR